MARRGGGALALTAGAAIVAGLVFSLLFYEPEPPRPSPEPPPASGVPVAPAPSPQTRRVGDKDVLAPVLVHRVEPTYPVAARRARMEGHVIIEAVVSDQGEVVSPKVLKSTAGPMLDQEALKAVRQWRYRPATLEGRPVRVYLTVTVTFRLN